MANYDVLVIGGGVIGLSLARELHRRDERRIAVLERGRVGREASFAAAGMLAPNAENELIDDFYRLCDASRQMYPKFAGELLAETGIDVELDRTGTIYAAFTDDDAEHIEVRFSRQQAAGIPVQRLSADETRKAEPSLAPDVRSSLFFPNDWQVENRKLLAALVRYAEINGIDVFEHTGVESVMLGPGGSAEGVLTSSGTFRSAATVLTAGAWTSLIQIGGRPVPVAVKPIRGQIISFAPQRRIFGHVIYSPRGYLVPRADGRVLIGATMEDAGFDRSTTAEAEQRLVEAAREFAPALNEMTIAETWAGLRPFAEGGLPVIGALPEFKDLFVGTAHFRNGILLAPVTARTLADSILSGSAQPGHARFAARTNSQAGGSASA